MTSAGGSIDLIIFDCDGVLVDSEMIASQVLADTLSDLGLPLDAAQCRARFTGLSIAAVVAAVEAETGIALPSDFTVRLRRNDVIAFERDLTAIPGVAQVLAHLDRADLDLAVCVASSGSMEKIHHSLTLTGLVDHFSAHLFSAEQVRHGKPAPDLFLFAARQMGCKPDRCLVIEDSVNGVRAARAANMEVLGFTGGAHWRGLDDAPLRRAGATRVFENMAALRDLLDQMGGA